MLTLRFASESLVDDGAQDEHHPRPLLVREVTERVRVDDALDDDVLEESP